MSQNKTAYFAGGCFWCTEAIFSRLKGILSVKPGYAGGQMVNPNYEDVSTSQTGHVETIKVEYDPAIISYNDLLSVFFSTHDPTALNRQGNDVGEQYRSMILYVNEEQKKQVEDYIAKLTEEKVFKNPIVTEIKPLDKFYEAEAYHEDYYEKHNHQPYCLLVINPKLKKLKEHYQHLLKN